jgi:hypothetical protein
VVEFAGVLGIWKGILGINIVETGEDKMRKSEKHLCESLGICVNN